MSLKNLAKTGLLAAPGPFEALLLWAVLEHFRETFPVAKLAAHLTSVAVRE